MSTAKLPANKMSPKPNSGHSAFLNLIVNIVFPALILNKFSGPEHLGPVKGMLLAMSLPVIYGAWEFFTTRHHNFISILGFVSILLTGGLGLLQVDGVWYAAKEAAIPGLIALITLGSLKTSKPLVKMMLYNDRVINIPVVEDALSKNGSQKGFQKLMVQTTLVLAVSFILSAFLNFVLAIWILKSPAGTPEFNAELGKMTALSYPVIVIPCLIVMMLAVWMLIQGLRRLTGLEMSEILSEHASGARK